MFGPAFFHDRVTRLRELQGLRHLLQCAFVISGGRQVTGWVGAADNVLDNKAPGRLDPAI